MAEQTVIQLRRRETSTPWGFRMQGGREFGTCLYIQKISSKSIAAKCGLQPGDGIAMIGNTPANYMSHEQAKMEIIRAGNELDLVVQRHAIDVGQDEVDTASSSGTRSQVSEESSEYRGFTNPSVQSRSFKVLQASLNYSEASGAEAVHVNSEPSPSWNPHREPPRMGTGLESAVSMRDFFAYFACQPVESYLFRYQQMYAPLIDKYREAEEDERDRKTTMLQNMIRQERGRSGRTRDVTRQDGGSGRSDVPGPPENRTEMIRYMVDTERDNVEDKLNMLRKISRNHSRSFSPEKPRSLSPQKSLSHRQNVADDEPTHFYQDALQTERQRIGDDGYVNLDNVTSYLPEKPLMDEKNVMFDNRSAQVHQNCTQRQEVVNDSYMRQEVGPMVRTPTAQASCFEIDLAQTEQAKAFQAPTTLDAFRPSPVQHDTRQLEVQQYQTQEDVQPLTSKVIQYQTQEIVSDTVMSEAGSKSVQYQTTEVEQMYNSANTMLLESKTVKVETEIAQMEITSTVVESGAIKNMVQRTPDKAVDKVETETSVERQSTVQAETMDAKVDESTMNVEAMAAKKAAEIIESAKYTIRAETKCSETKPTESFNAKVSESETGMFKTDSTGADVTLEFVTKKRETINSKHEAEQGQAETNETRAEVLKESVKAETYTIKSERMTSKLGIETAKSDAESTKSANEETKSDTKKVGLEIEAANSETWAVHEETETAKAETETKLEIDVATSETEIEMNEITTEASKYEAVGTDVIEKVEITTEIVDDGKIKINKTLTRKTEIVREFSYDDDDESYETWTEEESDNDIDSIIEETISKELETTGEETLVMETS